MGIIIKDECEQQDVIFYFKLWGGSDMPIHDVRPKTIQRIISLVPSATEILYFLGLEERIV